MHVNEIPNEVQPSNAVMATFTGPDAAAVESIFIDAGVDTDRIWVWTGPEGLSAYGERASTLSRLFDDSDDFVTSSLEAGQTLMIVHCVDEGEARSLQIVANTNGATKTSYFGDTTHSL